jgi:uracil-DNA glycosylase
MEKTSTNKEMSNKESEFCDIDISSEESTSDNEKIIVRTKKSIFLDDDEESDESDSDVTVHKKKINNQNKKIKIKPIIGNRCLAIYIMPDANNYNFKSWKECFPNKKVSLRSLMFNGAWNEFFDIIEKKPYFKKMEDILSKHLERDGQIILPHAELLFNAFNVLSPKKISAVIIGQDPYPGAEKINGKFIPQASGYCFSAPANFPKPLSLNNIYENLLQFGHIRSIPQSGCLSSWVLQGCFMINASLTTFYQEKNSHRIIWKNFTDDLIAYINKTCNNIVFLVWGKDAHVVCKHVDPTKHYITTSSHPSPLAYDKSMTGWAYGHFKDERDRTQLTFPSFRSTDHFGRANNYLKSVGKKEFLWDLLD